MHLLRGGYPGRNAGTHGMQSGTGGRSTEYSFIVLQKEGQEERKEMPIILSFLIAAGKYMLIGLAWMALEKHFYGEVQPRIVDDIIGLILFFYILKGEILQ